MIYSQSKTRGYLLVVLVIIFFMTSLTLFLLLIQGKTITQTGKIVDTGVIRVNSIPGNVNVFIDGKKATVSGNIIYNVPLGKVHLLLEKDGYTSWEKDINVVNGRVKEVFGQLYPSNLQQDQLITQNIDKVIYSNDQGNIYYSVLNSEIESEIGIWRYKLTSGFLNLSGSEEPVKIISFNSDTAELLRNNYYELNISANNNYLSINIPEPKRYIIFNVNNPAEIVLLEETLGFYPEFVSWSSEGNNLFIRNQGLLFEISINGQEKNLISYAPDNQPTFCQTSEGKIYWHDPITKLLREYDSGRSVVIPFASSILGQVEEIYCSNNKDMIILKNEKGLSYINFVTEYVNNFSNQGEILQVSENGLNVLFKENEMIKTLNVPTTQNRGETILAPVKILSNFTLNDSFYFSDSSTSIVRTVGNMDGTSSVLLSDIDGENETLIISNQNVACKQVDSCATSKLSRDNKTLFVLIENPLEETANNRNLYRIELN